MSLFKFGNFEADLDFTDADFLDALEEANGILQEDAKHLPVTGKNSDLIRAQVAVYNRFFDNIFEEGASDKMFTKSSLAERLDAAEKLAEFRYKEDQRFDDRLNQFAVKKNGNREQRRNYQKNQGGNKNRR